jgi:hypothetical protein
VSGANPWHTSARLSVAPEAVIAHPVIVTSASSASGKHSSQNAAGVGLRGGNGLRCARVEQPPVVEVPHKPVKQLSEGEGEADKAGHP